MKGSALSALGVTILHQYNSTVPPVKQPKLFTNVEGTQARTKAWFRIRVVAVHLTVPVFYFFFVSGFNDDK